MGICDTRVLFHTFYYNCMSKEYHSWYQGVCYVQVHYFRFHCKVSHFLLTASLPLETKLGKGMFFLPSPYTCMSLHTNTPSPTTFWLNCCSVDLFPQRRPVACGVTSLGMDHVSTLGGTLESIAWQKAGIFKVLL